MLIRSRLALLALTLPALILAVALAAMVLPGIARADGGVTCNFGRCTVEPPKVPGGGGTTTTPVGSNDDGFTPGPSKCYQDGKPKNKDSEIPCSWKGGAYQPAQGCYMKLASPQKAPPAGESASDGAWYDCSTETPKSCPAGQIVCVASSTQQWLRQPPPGIVAFTPAQAAAALVKRFQLKGATIGGTFNKSGKGAVGLPVWLWVNNQTPLTWGPYTETATLGGVTVTATAQVANIAWNMGDGQVKVCANAGTAYVSGYGNTDSPTCGYRYTKMSPGEGAQPYTITAVSNWDVTWSAQGQTGVIPTQTQSTTQVRIGELQAINVRP